MQLKPNKMNLFEKPIKDKIPFAVIRYNERLIGGKDSNEMAYELLKITKYSKPTIIMDGKEVVEFGYEIKGQRLTERQVLYFKSIRDKFEHVVQESYGSVWECNDFRKEVKKLKVEY